MTCKNDNKTRKISVITCCKNAEKYISQTIESVIKNQAIKNGDLELEYIIFDGASSDNTSKIIQNYCKLDGRIQLRVERDSGLYDALAKALKLVTGDFIAYINAGDVYHPAAFSVVSSTFSNSKVDWVTGIIVRMNDNSEIISANLPFRYQKELISIAAYGRWLPFIQQESTFWRREMIELIDLKVLSGYKLAGDFYIWACFSKKNNPFIVNSFLGAFRTHHGQLSQSIQKYRSEMKAIALKPKLTSMLSLFIDYILWRCPDSIKRSFNRRYHVWYCNAREEWSNEYLKYCEQ